MPRKAADSTDYSVVGHSHHPWEPGLSKLPYRGLGALFLSVAGVVVAIIVLLVSDGADVNHWRFQPSVYVAIASTVTNVTVAYALMEGVSISWWHKAMKNGTNVADLHRIWACGTSFVSALLSGRHINLVAIASFLVAISAINGPLLQRASTIGPANVDSTQRLQIEVAKLVPKGFTGIQTSRADQVNMLTTNFSSIAKDYYNRAAIPFKSGCIDNCRTSVLGAGFHANCSTYQAPFNATPGLDGDAQPATMFGSTLAYGVASNPAAASLNIQYKPKAGCVGESIVKNCSLAAGTVLYKVVINGPASSIALAPGTTIWDDVVVGKPDYLYGEDQSGVPSTYGGMFLALANQFNTNLQIQFGGGIGWEYLGTQSEASISYAHNISDGASCDIYFSDPTEDFLQSTRELMFRTAILSANETNIQHVSAQATGTHTVYHTNYLFVALATLVSVLAIGAVLLTFQGSQRLGREVSMSPIEVAKAFGAPLLRGANSNARASALVKQVGHRPLKYGAVSDTKVRRKPVANHFSRTPYTDEVPYGNGDTELDSGYSNALPAEPQQLANRSSRTPHASDSPYNNFSPDLGFSNTILTDRHQQQQDEHVTISSQLHTSWQTGQSSGFESDVELMDSRQRSDSSRTWLEIANPKSVAPLKSGMSFSDW